jgi:hypothetical protein
MEDARQIHGPTYGQFVEGFDMADLRAAKSLLESLPAEIMNTPILS